MIINGFTEEMCLTAFPESSDELFENYLSRPDVRQPILTQYCDGQRVQCRDRGWMTQWGSKTLGDQGYSPIEILRYFLGMICILMWQKKFPSSGFLARI